MKKGRGTQTQNSFDLTFDGLHYEQQAEDDWQARAERLQARRWHMLQQAMHERRLLH
jgi:hypothetical protein